MDASEREALVARFRAYLEQVPAAGEPAAEAASGTAADAEQQEAPDLFTLLAELAALKNDVRLESRQFKSALDQLSATCETLRTQSQELQEGLQRERRRAEAASEEADQDLLRELLELRDRMAAGCSQAAAYRPGLLARLGRTRRYLARMAEGMEMNLRHLDEILARRGVQAQETVYRPFDPQAMHAVETTEEPGMPDGTVVREVRTGYLRNGRVLRTAEVIVNKRGSET
ncbi:MAG: nucleotide exchange factor GrpE [Halorhodospira sp.]